MGQWTRMAEKAFEAYSRGVIETDYLDENVELVDPGFPQAFRGVEGVRGYLESLLTAFPDGKLTIRNAIECDDSVAIEVTFRGTHLGPLPIGVPATGKTVTLENCQVATIRGGKIVHLRIYGDNVTLMSQLGLMPALAPSS